MNNAENVAKLATAVIAKAAKDRAKAGQSGLTALVAGVVWAGQTGGNTSAVKTVRQSIESEFVGSYGREVTALLGWTAIHFREVFTANLTASFEDQVERAKTSILAACRMANVPEGLAGVAALKKGPSKAKSGGRSMFLTADEAKAAKQNVGTPTSEATPASVESETTPLIEKVKAALPHLSDADLATLAQAVSDLSIDRANRAESVEAEIARSA